MYMARFHPTAKAVGFPVRRIVNKSWRDKYQLVGISDVHDFEHGEDILEDGNIDMKGILLGILNTPAVLPLLKGIDTELDDLIERKLKK
jgi:hypothetical protein